MVATLFVQPSGVYTTIPGVDPWPVDRDARTYAGPWPVVAHPPCGPWGRYAKPNPESRARGPLRGDDAGCFASALASVRTHGGVLEHPKDSGAWSTFGLMPPGDAGWTRHLTRSHPAGGEWVCRVDQGHYGHAAQKSTWLYYVGDRPPPGLMWETADVAPIGTGARRGNLESLSKVKRAATPRDFAEVLVTLARWSRSDHDCDTFDPDSDCPECQNVWAEMVDAMSRPGANVRVTLPDDVAPWYDDTAFGASWVGDVYQPNGDSLDVFTPDGSVGPVPIEFCRTWRVGTYTHPGNS